jgi:hypothetical protein
MFSGLSAAIPEEYTEQFRGFGFEEALFDGDGVVEAFVGCGIVEGTRVPCFRVWGSVDEAADAGGVGGACAHGAGFQGGVEGAAGQAPAAEGSGGLADGEQFGVGCRVSRALALVSGDGQDLSISSDHGPYGDLTLLGGAPGGEQGAAHHCQVGGALIFVHPADDSSEMVEGVTGASLPGGRQRIGHMAHGNSRAHQP